MFTKKLNQYFAAKFTANSDSTVKDAKSAVTDRQTDQRMRVMEYPSSAE